MNTKITNEMKQELAELALRHEMSYDGLMWEIYKQEEYNYRRDDIMTRLIDLAEEDDKYVGKANDEELLDRITNAFFKHEDSDQSLCDNIDNAINGVLFGWY